MPLGIKGNSFYNLFMKEIKNSDPITKESLFSFVSQKLERKLLPKEVQGFKKLLKNYSPSDVQGYFLSVLADAQEARLSLSQYLKQEKRTCHGLIKLRITVDEINIEDADMATKDEEMWHEFSRKSPDLFQNPDDQG